MKSYKLGALLAAVLLLLGLILCIFGFAFKGKLHDSFGVHYGDIPFDREDNDFDDRQNKVKLSSFQHLEMDIDLGDITIKRGDELMLYTEQLDNDDYELIQEGDTLKIISHEDDFQIFSFDFAIPDYHYILTIPESIQLDSLKLESAMGDVDIQQVYVSNLDIEQAMGDVSLEDVVYQSMNIQQKMGDVEYEGKGQGNMEIDNSMGDISVKLKDDAKLYAYDISTSMGSIKTNFEKADGANKKLTNHPHTARYQLTLDCSMGEIELEFDDDFN